MNEDGRSTYLRFAALQRVARTVHTSSAAWKRGWQNVAQVRQGSSSFYFFNDDLRRLLDVMGGATSDGERER